MVQVSDTAGSDTALGDPTTPGRDLDASLPTQAPNELTPLDPDRAIFVEAKDRFERVQKWESTARNRWLEDLKFSEGDSLNSYQWPNAIRMERTTDDRPCLTINKTRQHNLHIINDAKQNKPSIKVRATGNGATVQSAKVLNAIMRHIEYVSNAQIAYDTAVGFAVRAGKGWLRIVTDWEDAESFQQVPRIARVIDPLTVYVDPDAKEADKSDARWGFVFDDLPREEFDKLYPDFKGQASAQVIDDATGWIRDDTVRIAEYYRKVEKDDKIFQLKTAQGTQTFYESELAQAPALLEHIKADPTVRFRATKREVIEWYLLIGSKVVQRNIWPGRYVPLIPVVGEETVIQGEYDCKGHTRALLDPQRMYNYMSSVAVEYSAVQTKTPWVAPAEAIEGYEVDWANANRVNKSLLAYNALSEDGQTEIPAPQRIPPPVAMPAALEGMNVASNEMMFASGQYQADMGQQGNERSAKAINERQRSAANATYHFVDNLAIAVRAVGRQLIDLIPKLYTSETILSILAEDGTSMEVRIDPTLQQAAQLQQQNAAQAIQAILFNPNVGKYDVQADVGPSWGTKREETFNALSLILTQAPQLTALIGDLLLQSSDFDLAQEAAERLRRMVPQQAMGTGPTPTEQQLQQQVQAMSGLLQETMQELANEKLKLRGKDALRDVDAYNARTERLRGLVDAATKQGIPVDPAELQRIIEGTSEEIASAAPLSAVEAASAPALQAAAATGSGPLNPLTPPVPGARRGPDGHWYVRNYARSGQYALVA